MHRQLPIRHQIQRCAGLPRLNRHQSKLFTLRESPPAHPKTATRGKSIDYPETMPRRVALIREVEEHAEEQRAGEAAVSQEGGKEEELEEEEGEEEEETVEEDEEEDKTRRDTRPGSLASGDSVQRSVAPC